MVGLIGIFSEESIQTCPNPKDESIIFAKLEVNNHVCMASEHYIPFIKQKYLIVFTASKRVWSFLQKR